MDVLSKERLVSAKSFFPLHMERFLSTFRKYLAVITAHFKRRRKYSHNLLSKKSSLGTNQLNTTPQRAAKTTRDLHRKLATNKWRMFTFYLGQSMCVPSLVFPFTSSTIKPPATEISEKIFDPLFLSKNPMCWLSLGR